MTITGPHSVCRMTNTLEIKRCDKVLEIGTGSGYQSAVLSNLTPNVFSIEIIPPLAQRTRALYDSLIARGYTEYAAIKTKNADGYYGWAEQAPFDKIIVTCGIDHVPPPLLQQMKLDGIMVIPVGPPGAQHVLKVTKKPNSDGSITAVRSDIYNGQIVNVRAVHRRTPGSGEPITAPGELGRQVCSGRERFQGARRQNARVRRKSAVSCRNWLKLYISKIQ